MLAAWQALAYLSLVPMVLYATPLQWGTAIAVMYFVGVVGITTTYHRLLAHRAFKPQRWFYYVGSLVGVYGIMSSPLAWVGIHIEHHKHTDKHGDPHSPHLLRWWQVKWTIQYRALKKAPPYLARDPFQRFIHTRYFTVHLLILAAFLTFYPFGAIYLYLAPAALGLELGHLVNLFSHRRWFGYRRYATDDHSVNNPVLAAINGGEGLHNNHHGDPRNPNFSRRWWEIDVGYWLVRAVRQRS